MNFFKLFLLSVFSFFLLFTIIGFLFPSAIHTVKSININKNKESTFLLLRNEKSWLKWNPLMNDKEMNFKKNKDTESVYYKDKILQIFNKKIDSNGITFSMKNYNGTLSEDKIIISMLDGNTAQTQVVWYEQQKLKWYPWDRFKGLILEKSKGEYLDSILANFKIYADTVKYYN